MNDLAKTMLTSMEVAQMVGKDHSKFWFEPGRIGIKRREYSGEIRR